MSVNPSVHKKTAGLVCWEVVGNDDEFGVKKRAIMGKIVYCV